MMTDLKVLLENTARALQDASAKLRDLPAMQAQVEALEKRAAAAKAQYDHYTNAIPEVEAQERAVTAKLVSRQAELAKLEEDFGRKHGDYVRMKAAMVAVAEWSKERAA
jgi:chromosome segregation ATPase